MGRGPARRRWEPLARTALGVGLLASVVTATPASGAPQATVGLQSGLCGRGDGATPSDSRWGWDNSCWYNALYADVLWGRERATSFGFGPALEVGSASFGDLRLGGGATLQVPLSEHLGSTVTALAFGRYDGDWAPGVGGHLFLGARNYNFHSRYGVAAGLVLGMQRTLGAEAFTTWIAAAQVDVVLLAMPAILVVNAFR